MLKHIMKAYLKISHYICNDSSSFLPMQIETQPPFSSGANPQPQQTNKIKKIIFGFIFVVVVIGFALIVDKHDHALSKHLTRNNENYPYQIHDKKTDKFSFKDFQNEIIQNFGIKYDSKVIEIAYHVANAKTLTEISQYCFQENLRCSLANEKVRNFIQNILLDPINEFYASYKDCFINGKYNSYEIYQLYTKKEDFEERLASYNDKGLNNEQQQKYNQKFHKNVRENLCNNNK